MEDNKFEDKINSIICGDNIETLKTFPDNSIDLTITSPPYDSIRNYGGLLDAKENKNKTFSFNFEGLAKQLLRVTKLGGVVVWNVNDQTVDGLDGGSTETGTSFRQAIYFKEIGFNIHDTMIWSKPGVAYPDKTRYHQTFEYMFILSKGMPKSINLIKDKKNKSYDRNKLYGNTLKKKREQGNGKEEIADSFKSAASKEFGLRYNIWKINSEATLGNFEEWNWHPAIFPSSLAHDHILSWSNENDLILDPFSGSGTVAKCAKILKRNYIGLEINEKYVEKSRNRISQYGSLDNKIENENGEVTDFIQF